jgi:hypothetical protein
MTRILAGVALLVFAVTLSISAFAGSKAQTFTLYHDSQLNGTALPAGEYTVVYDEAGANPQVKFMKGKKEVASATGQLKQLDKKPQYNQIVLTNEGGSDAISELDFHGSTTGITFNSSVANAGK